MLAEEKNVEKLIEGKIEALREAANAHGLLMVVIIAGEASFLHDKDFAVTGNYAPEDLPGLLAHIADAVGQAKKITGGLTVEYTGDLRPAVQA